MRTYNLDKNKSWGGPPGRSLSPNSFANRGNHPSNNNVSVHSDHLWNMLE